MSVSATSVSPVVNAMALLKLANGEYSASSVATDPTDANRLGLMKLKDGNYASLLFAGAASVSSSPASKSSAGVQAALQNLVLGG